MPERQEYFSGHIAFAGPNDHLHGSPYLCLRVCFRAHIHFLGYTHAVELTQLARDLGEASSIAVLVAK